MLFKDGQSVSQGEEVEGEYWCNLGKLPRKYSQGPEPGRPRTSDGRPAMRTTRSHNREHGLQQEAPRLSVERQMFNAYSAGRN